jgi:hypothetical protein
MPSLFNPSPKCSISTRCLSASLSHLKRRARDKRARPWYHIVCVVREGRYRDSAGEEGSVVESYLSREYCTSLSSRNTPPLPLLIAYSTME